jgi:phage shock protein E
MSKIVIDVRESLEYKVSHAPGAINIPLMQMAFQTPPALEGTPKYAEIIVYCACGHSAGLAANMLKKKGFTNVKNGINQKHLGNPS